MLLGASLAAILLGSVHFALLLGKLRGIDIREHGSGNVGATNLGRTLGLRWGVAAFLLDAAKGLLPVVALVLYQGQPTFTLWPTESAWGVVAVGAGAVLGHCYSPFVGFRGGKGVATSAGALLGIQWSLALVLLSVWCFWMAVFRVVGVASVLTAMAAAAIGCYYLTDGRLLPVGVFLLALALVVIIRHRSNIRRFFGGGTAADPTQDEQTHSSEARS